MGRERGGGLYIYRITANKINNTEYTTRLVYKISKFLGVMLYYRLPDFKNYIVLYRTF